MPTADRLRSFYERSEERVQFSIKANRLLTHEITPRWADAVTEFKSAVAPLAQRGKLCAVLFQFPQGFRYTDENRIYLARLIGAFAGYPVLIEFRHAEWIRPSVFQGLTERGAGLVYCDLPKLAQLPDGKALQSPDRRQAGTGLLQQPPRRQRCQERKAAEGDDGTRTVKSRKTRKQESLPAQARESTDTSK